MADVVTYTFRIAQNLSFYDYIDELDLELYEFIDNWMLNNAVSGKIGSPRIGETQCQWFPHLPMKNDDGAPITDRSMDSIFEKRLEVIWILGPLQFSFK